MSDFYAAWFQLKLLYASLAPKIDLAKYILAAMNGKKCDRLLTCPLVLCSVFLDPRIKVLLLKSHDQSYVAKLYLAQLWERISKYEEKNMQTKTDETDDTAKIPLEFNFDLLVEFMLDGGSNMDANTDIYSNNNNKKIDILSLLSDFESQKSEPMTKDLFQYWEENKSTSPELYKLATMVHAVPPAQASCERTFSTLSFVFNKYRSQLSEELLQNILLIKLNKDLFYQATQDEVEKKMQKECEF